MDSLLKGRVLQYIDFKQIEKSRFEKESGLSNGFVDKIGDSIRSASLDKIRNGFPDLNIDWLLTGEGDMLKDNETKATNHKVGYSTYLLPLSAMGGGLVGFAEKGVELKNCEAIVSPIKDVDFAITIYGESMSPEYPSGSKVLIKKIDPCIFIDWGKVYVLDTSNGVVVKEVHKSEKEEYVSCYSINKDPKFAPFEIPTSEIYGMYRVLMCLSMK